MERPRHIEFDACLNFRDLGGYPVESGGFVRWGKLYRSMTPQFMTEEDVRRAVEELGVRRVIDLRDRDDADSGPLGQAPNERYVVKFAEFARVPEVRDLPTLEVLVKHLDYSAAGIAEAIEIIAGDGEGATVFHCHTGKDRTGVLATVLLRLLGVEPDIVVADYMLGAEQVKDVQALINVNRRQTFAPPRSALEPLDANAIRAVIDRLDSEFGGARAYVHGLGVSNEVIDRFIAEMVE